MIKIRAFRNLFISLLLLASTLPASADRSDIEASLKSEYRQKVFMLRHFYAGQKLRFNSEGTLIKGAGQGYWSSDGLVEIGTVSFEKNGTLLLTGNRIASVFDYKKGKFKNFKTALKLDIEVESDPNRNDLQSFRTVLETILTPDSGQLAKTAPSYWSCWFSGKIEPDGKKNWKCVDSQSPTTTTAKDGTAERVRNELSAPHPLHTPDPSYTEIAKKIGLQGVTVLQVVINEKGDASKFLIVRPLGAGLDDAAVDAVRGWKFTPAEKAGTPVSVQVNIEVNFRLY